jgi:hypothetical protein
MWLQQTMHRVHFVVEWRTADHRGDPGHTITQVTPGHTITQVTPGHTRSHHHSSVDPGHTITQVTPGHAITQVTPGRTITQVLAFTICSNGISEQFDLDDSRQGRQTLHDVHSMVFAVISRLRLL